ncbi:hypothetical protein [Archangium violaceum]|uniref:hypothetical protein n=1 Tax=Archangium violaceum TaxID=83451 RepID=UPI0037BFF28B
MRSNEDLNHLRAVKALGSVADRAIRQPHEQALEARAHVLLWVGPDFLLHGLPEGRVVVLRQHEDGLLALAALRHILLQLHERLAAQSLEQVEVAEERGQGDDDPDAHSHFEER